MFEMPSVALNNGIDIWLKLLNVTVSDIQLWPVRRNNGGYRIFLRRCVDSSLMMKPLVFRFLMPNGVKKELTISPDDVESIILPSAEHEAGHIIAAHHFGGRVLGIAVGFIPDQQGMFLQALYQPKEWSVEMKCIVKAAGPAADVIYFGSCSEKGASRDLADIEVLTGNKFLEPYLTKAKEILSGYKEQFGCITAALHESLQNGEERLLERLPDHEMGALLLDEDQLMAYLD